MFNSSRFQVINSPLIRLDVATMERHYQTVESVIYLECYIDQKSVGGGVGEIKLHDRAQTCHWRVKLKLFCFHNIFVFSFFFFFFITQNFTIPHFALAVK